MLFNLFLKATFSRIKNMILLRLYISKILPLNVFKTQDLLLQDMLIVGSLLFFSFVRNIQNFTIEIIVIALKFNKKLFHQFKNLFKIEKKYNWKNVFSFSVVHKVSLSFEILVVKLRWFSKIALTFPIPLCGKFDFLIPLRFHTLTDSF